MHRFKLSALALLSIPVCLALPASAQEPTMIQKLKNAQIAQRDISPPPTVGSDSEANSEANLATVKIGTLGPEGTNHELNTKRYIFFHQLKNAEIIYYDELLSAAADLEAGEIDKVIILPANSQYKPIITEYFDTGRIFRDECFIGPNHGMGLLKRRGWSEKDSIAFYPSTKGFFDSENYATLMTVRSNTDAGFQLMAGVTNWAYTFTSFAQRYPSQVEIVSVMPTPPLPDDPLARGWHVYSTTPSTVPVTECREPTEGELAIIE